MFVLCTSQGARTVGFFVDAKNIKDIANPKPNIGGGNAVRRYTEIYGKPKKNDDIKRQVIT
jgi:hypothetical protein